MNTKLVLTPLCLLLSFGAFADTPAQQPNGPRGPRGDMMANLTEEQKTCIASFGCKQPELNDQQRKPSGERPEKPAGERPEGPTGEKPSGERPERPEMSDEEKENMECMKQAMESCGIEMPTPQTKQ